MRHYYRLDGTRLTVRELWRIAPSVLAFVDGVIRHKLLRRPLANQPAFPRIDRLDRIPAAALPAELQPLVARHTTEFEALGLARQFIYRAPALGGPAEGYATVFLHGDGRSIGTAIMIVHRAAGR